VSAALKVKETLVYTNGSDPLQTQTLVEVTRATLETDFVDTEQFFAAIDLIFKHSCALQNALIYTLAAIENEQSGIFSSRFDNLGSAEEGRVERVASAKPHWRRRSTLTRKGSVLVEMLRPNFIRELYFCITEVEKTKLSGGAGTRTEAYLSQLLRVIPAESHDFLRALFAMARMLEEEKDLLVSAVIEQLITISNEAPAPPGAEPRRVGLITNMQLKKILVPPPGIHPPDISLAHSVRHAAEPTSKN
jgi:hypothetical protein